MQKIFDEPVTGTEYAPNADGIALEYGQPVTLFIFNPAATDRTYTIQVSGMDDRETKGGANRWADDTVLSPGARSGVTNDIVIVNYPVSRVRVKIDQTSGTNNTVIDAVRGAP
jgi:hypothetical protein